MKEAFTTTARMYYNAELNLLKIVLTEGAHLGLEDIRNHFIVAQRLSEGKKTRVMTDARANYSISAEARDEAAKLSVDSRIATAVVTSNPVSRFITNLYIRVSQPKSPTRLFRNEAEAMEWLDTFH